MKKSIWRNLTNFSQTVSSITNSSFFVSLRTRRGTNTQLFIAQIRYFNETVTAPPYLVAMTNTPSIPKNNRMRFGPRHLTSDSPIVSLQKTSKNSFQQSYYTTIRPATYIPTSETVPQITAPRSDVQSPLTVTVVRCPLAWPLQTMPHCMLQDQSA